MEFYEALKIYNGIQYYMVEGYMGLADFLSAQAAEETNISCAGAFTT